LLRMCNARNSGAVKCSKFDLILSLV